MHQTIFCHQTELFLWDKTQQAYFKEIRKTGIFTFHSKTTSAKPFTQQKCTWIMKVQYGHSVWQRGISISLTRLLISKIFYISSVSKRQVVLCYHKHKEERISKTHFLEKAKLPKSYVKFSWRILNFSTSALVFFLLSAVFANKERWETFCCCLHLFLKMVSYCYSLKRNTFLY